MRSGELPWRKRVQNPQVVNAVRGVLKLAIQPRSNNPSFSKAAKLIFLPLRRRQITFTFTS